MLLHFIVMADMWQVAKAGAQVKVVTLKDRQTSYRWSILLLTNGIVAVCEKKNY